MPSLTLSLSDETDQALEAIALATERTKSDVIERAVLAYLSQCDWQTAAIREGIAEADAGELVDHLALRRHWESKLADSLD